MKTTTKLFCLAAAAAALAFTGCKNEPAEPVYRTIGTVLNPDKVSDYILLSDGGERLKPLNSPYVPEHRQRLIADFYITEEMGEGSDYDYGIEYTYLYEILTKGIFNVELNPVTEAQEDSIGHDAFVQVGKPWIASDFLNVEFLVRSSNSGIKHFINLVAYADSVPATDGKVHLQLRHHSKGDLPNYDSWGIVAFDLLPLREQFATADSLNIVVHAPLYGEKETVQEVVYRLGGEETDEGESVPATTLSSLQLE